MVTKWKHDEKRIITYVAEGRKTKLLKKGRESNKHHAVFVELYQPFAKARSLGRKVPCAWFYLNTNKINAELNPNGPRKPKSAAMRFIKHCNIKLRRIQRKKQVQKGRFEEKMKQWHSSLRETRIKTGQSYSA